ncbi:phage tail protein [Campylobacter sp. RM9344]|uniref:Phage tail protein n=1 Tax=Campylobacter californiensis TaxID=1032243 RepID=A0AAW3ZVE9_9BACT|nr:MULTISPECIES: contractile injection system protein, VgrG/Pvc8 family [unclassified Campylobacter]MBE3029688.1 phage tail protein [Campylobacter sp. RM9344]MBE3607173.1 phage tail protein [Campylobacter sp. RM9337]MBE3609527.1 phage tail protein [Campylobacter sp. RM12916]QCD50360.1 phage protein D [Campylobacter sp. RM6914]
MVRVPNFKLLAKGNDITAKIKSNLISLSYEDKEGSESDEIAFVVNGIYAKPMFGDNLELWLGYEDNLYHCGKFSVQTATRDYKANTTEVRATAVNFASPQKLAKRRSWENTSLFAIASKIAAENKLNVKTSGTDQPIASVLQNDISDLDFLYGICFEYGYIMKVANNTVIITSKDAKGDDTQTSNTAKNENLPKFSIELSECESLSITEANRNSYTAVIVQWHDSKEGKDKQAKVGSGEQTYKLNIPEPKSDNEAFKKGEVKLNELQRGGINGSLTATGRELRAGGKLKVLGVNGLNGVEFSIKSVSHNLNTKSYMVDVEFEG